MQDFEITGIGGVFFAVNNKQAVEQWYQQHFNWTMNEYGALFESRNFQDTSICATLQWGPMCDTTFFEPSSTHFMINYRVRHLDALLQHLDGKAVLLDSVQSYSYGRFVHIMDPDGNKIELWEPIDTVFEQLYQGKMNAQMQLGGVFFKSARPQELKQWYQAILGLSIDQYGCMFKSRNAHQNERVQMLQWSVFDAATTYFEPSDCPFMLNYTVADLDAMVASLKAKNVTFLDEKEVTEYGDFIHILGPENHKIELWQPPLFDSF